MRGGAFARTVALSARLVAGRRYWLVPLAPLAWLIVRALILLAGGQPIEASDAQNELIGLPMVVLAIVLGVRIIAGEIDRRSLEIAYTVPGGAHRVWLGKLAAVVLILLAAEALLALATVVFFTAFSIGALVGALQAALVYLVLAMAFGALFRSEVAGALAAAVVLVVNGLLSGFGGNQGRLSPLFNPGALAGTPPEQLLAWTVQNRIGFALVIVGLTALAFARADRREKMLSG